MASHRIVEFPDRRRSYRRPINIDVTIITASGEALPGVTIDANAHGMAAVVFGEIAPGDYVRLHYGDPGDATGSIATNAVVKAWDGRHAGFEFLHAARAEQG